MKIYLFLSLFISSFRSQKVSGSEIKRNDGAGLLEAIQERFEQLAHGRKGIVVKQGSHPLPEHALAAQLRPYRLEQGATQLLGLVHQERQQHQYGKHHRKMLLAMPVVMLKVVA